MKRLMILLRLDWPPNRLTADSEWWHPLMWYDRPSLCCHGVMLLAVFLRQHTPKPKFHSARHVRSRHDTTRYLAHVFLAKEKSCRVVTCRACRSTRVYNAHAMTHTAQAQLGDLI